MRIPHAFAVILKRGIPTISRAEFQIGREKCFGNSLCPFTLGYSVLNIGQSILSVLNILSKIKVRCQLRTFRKLNLRPARHLQHRQMEQFPQRHPFHKGALSQGPIHLFWDTKIRKSKIYRRAFKTAKNRS